MFSLMAVWLRSSLSCSRIIAHFLVLVLRTEQVMTQLSLWPAQASLKKVGMRTEEIFALDWDWHRSAQVECESVAGHRGGFLRASLDPRLLPGHQASLSTRRADASWAATVWLPGIHLMAPQFLPAAPTIWPRGCYEWVLRLDCLAMAPVNINHLKLPR